MKKILIPIFIFSFVLFASQMCLAQEDYDFEDDRSVALTEKAWEALDKKDLNGVLAYTNECIDLYGEEARTMQEGLDAYPKGGEKEVFKYWALNDVATCYFIQGEAYRKARMRDKANEAYTMLIEKYKYGQCWDPDGWFWKPAQAAKKKLKSRK